MPEMIQNHIGERVKALREGARMRQDDLKSLLGLNSRQSVSQIENGTRRLTADELVTVLKRFDVTLDRLTNPFFLMSRGVFSWRQRGLPNDVLNAFEERAGEWIGAYRALKGLSEGRPSRLLPNTGLTYTSPFEDAASVGEVLSAQLKLGDRPAMRLADTLETQLDILVLMVDATPGISGAACRLPQLNAILINRRESLARRNSDLAHELFHLLTWSEMRPEHFESSEQTWDQPNQLRSRKLERNQRIEQLADHFASGLLLPATSLDLIGEPKGNLAQWLTEAASFLGVSSRNLKWRLINSRRHPEVASVKESDLVAAGQARTASSVEPLPLIFSRPFMATIVQAVEKGDLSGQRVAALLGMARDEVGEICLAYNLHRPVELGGDLRPGELSQD